MSLISPLFTSTRIAKICAVERRGDHIRNDHQSLPLLRSILLAVRRAIFGLRSARRGSWHR